MKTLVWTDAIPESVLDMVRDLIPDGFELVVIPQADQETAREYAKEADYLLCSGTVKINGDLLDAAPSLRHVQKFGVGIETLDLDAIRERGLTACNTTNINSVGVAEHVVLLTLAMLRRLPLVDQRLRATGQFTKWDLRPRCHELSGKTVGIIGFGAIGQEVAKRLKAFDTHILYNRRNRIGAEEERRLDVRFMEIDDLVCESDIVCLTVPLTPQTRHLINHERLAAMKDTAFLVNAARGAVVDEAALVEALQCGAIAGAALDVYDPEPPSPDHPLFEMENVVVTPHTAGATRDTFRKSFAKAIENIQLIDRGAPPHQEDVLISDV